MGTRGCYGFRKNGIDKLTYNHYDSYPDGLGSDVVKFCKETPVKEMNAIFDMIVLVDESSMPNTEQIAECIEYYGGTIAGISAIFSATPKVGKHDINSIFTADDVPGYGSYKMKDCPYCKNKQKLDAIVNAYGYSKI